MEEYIEKVTESKELENLIRISKSDASKCDRKLFEIHRECFANENDTLQVPQCPSALIYTLIKFLAIKPKLFDDTVKEAIANYFRSNDIEARGLVSVEILTILFQTHSPLMTWLKYETLLCYLIKEYIYKPKTMANEVLATVKAELKPEIAARFSSVMKTCVKYCRDANKNGSANNEVEEQDEEEEKEKWCEIIDWMSWFIVAQDDDDFS